MCCKVCLSNGVTLTPFAAGGILAKEENTESHEDNDDARDNERNTPSSMRSQTSVQKRVVYRWHEEVRHATSSITEACSDSICRTDNILVEEPSRPHLTGHEAATQYTDEESESKEFTFVIRCAG